MATQPLLARRSARSVAGHPNPGNGAGSAAHPDRARAEIPAVLSPSTLSSWRPARRHQRDSARRFYRYAYETDLAPDEILTGIHVPLPTNGHANGASFYEVAIPNHNFALAGAAVRVTLQSGCLQDVRIALCALGPTPLRAREAETLAEGCPPSSDVVERVARAAATIVEPVDDVLARRNTSVPAPVGSGGPCWKLWPMHVPGRRGWMTGFTISRDGQRCPDRRGCQFEEPLVDHLATIWDSTGTHVGCDEGVCGADRASRWRARPFLLAGGAGRRSPGYHRRGLALGPPTSIPPGGFPYAHCLQCASAPPGC